MQYAALLIRAHAVYDDPFDAEYLEDLEWRQNDDDHKLIRLKVLYASDNIR